MYISILYFEYFMRQALVTALVTLFVVLLTGILLGWQYALWMASLVLMAITLMSWRR